MRVSTEEATDAMGEATEATRDGRAAYEVARGSAGAPEDIAVPRRRARGGSIPGQTGRQGWHGAFLRRRGY